MSLPAIKHDIRFEDHQATFLADRKATLDELLARDPESWSSLQGLFALMRLPATEEGRQHLEVERAEGWMQVDAVDVRDGMVTFTKGHNGHSEVYSVLATGPLPRWRVAPRFLADRYI